MPVYVPIVADSANPQLKLPGAAAMGETTVHTMDHPVYLDGTYGIQTDLVEELTNSTGTIAVNGSRQIEVSTGTGIYGYAVARSQRMLRWRPGTSQAWTACAAFPTAGVASSTLRAGAVSQLAGIYYGYENTTFGIHIQDGGNAELVELELTASAAGPENATVTVGGTAYTVPLTSGSTTHNAAEIAADAAIQADWVTAQVDNLVYFFDRDNSPKAASSFSSASAAGTMTVLQTGASDSVTTIAQADWNKDVMDGSSSASNPSGLTLYPSQLNIYRCVFTWEVACFYIYNPSQQSFVLVHTQSWLGESRRQLVPDPTMQIGAVAASLGSTTDIQVILSWVSAESDAGWPPVRNPRGTYVRKTGLTTGGDRHLITVKTGLVLDKYLNQSTVYPLTASIFNGSSKDAVVLVRLNAMLVNPLWASLDDNSCANVDTSGTSPTGGLVVGAFVIPGNTESLVNLSELDILLDREETLTLSINVTSGAVFDSTASIVWRERA